MRDLSLSEIDNLKELLRDPSFSDIDHMLKDPPLSDIDHSRNC